MKLKGVLDFSLGNFLCMRGFARMGDLYALSEPDLSFQRNLLQLHEKEMIAFLREGKFLFFPEVILSTTLSPDEDDSEEVRELFENVQAGQRFSKLKFPDYSISCTVNKTKSGEDTRAVDIFRTASLELNAKSAHKFSRIDGNHRLSATPKDQKFEAYNTPFCLLLFRNSTEAAQFSRAIFHNINYKIVQLTMEENLRLILEDAAVFPDDDLKSEPFGWPYYHARKLYGNLDFDILANIKPFINKEPRTFFVQQFAFLNEKGVLKDNDKAIKLFKEALGKVNGLFDTSPMLIESTNRGLLSALVYYQLAHPGKVPSFVRWVLANNLHLIKDSSSADLIAIFDKVIESKNRTIFVSMPFGKPKADDHYATIERVAKEVSEAHKLKPKLEVARVDWFHDGTSYEINDKIIEMITGCGYFIGNLTYCNLNVYHEVGFVMGKAKAEGKDVPDMLLFLDESVPDKNDKFVGFNLTGIKQVRFAQIEVEFAPKLKENLEKFYKLKA